MVQLYPALIFPAYKEATYILHTSVRSHCKIIRTKLAVYLNILQSTAVSTKVVPQKRKSVRDNADWYYG